MKEREVRMTLEEAHEYELQLEKELKSLCPKSKALRFYPSTWKAIESYEKAVKRIHNRRRKIEYPSEDKNWKDW